MEEKIVKASIVI